MSSLQPPLLRFEAVDFSYMTNEGSVPVLGNIQLDIPLGITGFMGPNGTGKTTLLLLSSGRLMPTKGVIRLLGKDTSTFANDEEKNKLASVVFQNLEFENPEPVGELLEIVLQSGFHSTDFQVNLLADVKREMELGKILNRPTHVLSKGEMQRVVLAFSILYGSLSMFLDEPIFALEDQQKPKILDFIKHYARETGRSVVLCLHEMELTQKFSENILLFSKHLPLKFGPTSEVYIKEILESAYEVPWELMKKRENLKKEMLIRGEKISTETLEKSRIID